MAGSEDRVSRHTDLEAQNAALREAIAELQAHVASQAQQISEYEDTEASPVGPSDSQGTIDGAADVTTPALLMVAHMTENRAATMAIVQGCDVAEYDRLIKLAHRLRAAVGEAAERYEAEAIALYDELTQSPK